MADDLDRRITALEARVNSIDQHGSRYTEGMRVELAGMRRDMGKLERVVETIDGKLDAMPRSWPRVVTLLAVMVPMYALVIDLIATRH